MGNRVGLSCPWMHDRSCWTFSRCLPLHAQLECQRQIKGGWLRFTDCLLPLHTIEGCQRLILSSYIPLWTLLFCIILAHHQYIDHLYHITYMPHHIFAYSLRFVRQPRLTLRPLLVGVSITNVIKKRVQNIKNSRFDRNSG